MLISLTILWNYWFIIIVREGEGKEDCAIIDYNALKLKLFLRS